MNDAQTHAWLFLSVPDRPALLPEVIAAADAIDHAIPTEAELRRSLGWLQAQGLIRKEGEAYSLTGAGVAVRDACSGSSSWSRMRDAVARRFAASESVRPNYPYRIDEANGVVHAWFIRMEYRGGPVVSELEPRLTPFEDRYYDLYQAVGNEIFADLLAKLHSNIRQFFPLDEVRRCETYLWLEGGELVGSIRIRHDEARGSYDIERVMVAPGAQGKGYGTQLLSFAVARLQQTHRTPIALTVAAGNEGAVRLYERFGFVRVGEELETWKIEGGGGGGGSATAGE